MPATAPGALCPTLIRCGCNCGSKQTTALPLSRPCPCRLMAAALSQSTYTDRRDCKQWAFKHRPPKDKESNKSKGQATQQELCQAMQPNSTESPVLAPSPIVEASLNSTAKVDTSPRRYLMALTPIYSVHPCLHLSHSLTCFLSPLQKRAICLPTLAKTAVAH